MLVSFSEVLVMNLMLKEGDSATLKSMNYYLKQGDLEDSVL